MDKHIIYKVTAPNGKIYIGKTSRNLELRKAEHKYYANRVQNSRSLFYRAIKKYGDALQWEIIEEVLDADKANEAEKKWIAVYNSTDKSKGYNLTHGGDGGKQTSAVNIRRIAASSATLKLPEVRKKLSDSCKKYRQNNDCSRHNVNVKIARSSEVSRKKTSIRSREKYAKRFQGFKDGILIGEWLIKGDAARDLDLLDGSGICKVLNGKWEKYCGYTFKYINSGTH